MYIGLDPLNFKCVRRPKEINLYKPDVEFTNQYSIGNGRWIPVESLERYHDSVSSPIADLFFRMI